MITRFGAWPPIARRATIPAAAITAALMLAGSASAAAQAGTAHRATARSNLQALFSNVPVYGAPRTQAKVAGLLGSAGSMLSITCWTTGSVYNNSPIWYQISAPIPGYVAALNLVAHFAPAVGIAHCPNPLFRRQYSALEPGLRIRATASTGAQITGTLVNIGSQVTIDCYVAGSPIYGDPVWYHAVAPATGYLTGRFLNTGGDPDIGVPPC